MPIGFYSDSTRELCFQCEREKGSGTLEAIREACLLRLWPILMTTFAAMLAGVALAAAHGTGSDFQRPLGFAIVGGLLLSQLLTLYTTPVIYVCLSRRPIRGGTIIQAPASG